MGLSREPDKRPDMMSEEELDKTVELCWVKKNKNHYTYIKKNTNQKPLSTCSFYSAHQGSTPRLELTSM